MAKKAKKGMKKMAKKGKPSKKVAGAMKMMGMQY